MSHHQVPSLSLFLAVKKGVFFLERATFCCLMVGSFIACTSNNQGFLGMMKILGPFIAGKVSSFVTVFISLCSITAWVQVFESEADHEVLVLFALFLDSLLLIGDSINRSTETCSCLDPWSDCMRCYTRDLQLGGLSMAIKKSLPEISCW